MRCQKLKMICQSPDGKNRVVRVHYQIAWAAARGVAKDTHHAVILYGEFGTARFDMNGAGHVEWNDKSTIPGEITRFSDNSIVCI